MRRKKDTRSIIGNIFLLALFVYFFVSAVYHSVRIYRLEKYGIKETCTVDDFSLEVKHNIKARNSYSARIVYHVSDESERHICKFSFHVYPRGSYEKNTEFVLLHDVKTAFTLPEKETPTFKRSEIFVPFFLLRNTGITFIVSAFRQCDFYKKKEKAEKQTASTENTE